MFGRLFGKTKFVKNISPNKTTEGVVGAIVVPTVNLLFFYFLGQLTDGQLSLKMPVADYIFLGISCSILCILGDLAESFIKRCCNVKDSSSLLPEHGGMLDRADSLAFVVPFLYWYSLQLIRIKGKSDYDPTSIHFI